MKTGKRMENAGNQKENKWKTVHFPEMELEKVNKWMRLKLYDPIKESDYKTRV